jgi:pimeloyl-ACP methyl ester carboxylesterase
MAAPPSVVPEDLVVCMRGVSDGAFNSDIGPTTYLKVPPPAANVPPIQQGQVAIVMPTPANAVPDQTNESGQDIWFQAVIDEATRGGPRLAPPGAPNATVSVPSGDVLVFIHGYNNDQTIVMQRHRQLRKDLTDRGFAGAVVSFDWPSGDEAIDYLSDRNKASAIAVRLVNDLVFPFAARVRLADCAVNVHVLAHSTGAYLFQETVDMSDENHGIASVNWTVSQLMLIGADIDQPAMEEGNGDGESMIAHATRVTNYSNLYDDVLKLSNIKRAGMDPRIGRVGLPGNTPPNCVNVDCSQYYSQNRANRPNYQPLYGTLSHSWQIGDPVWTDDLYWTIMGNLDRSAIPTRGNDDTGALILA